MANKPRVLIPVPTSFDPEYNERSWPEYAAAVERSGGLPVRLALTHAPSELERMMGEAQALLLPGSGADVDPARYGRQREQATAMPDPARENTDYILLEAAERRATPLLAICFGTQILNVWRGGTLVQDLPPLPVNHRAGRAVTAAHAISVQPDTRLAAMLDHASGDSAPIRFTANSSHHQAIALAGEDLRVVARSSEDGVVEAVEGTDPHRWLFGVQWHPERTMLESQVSRSIFDAFIDAARARLK